ncbi:MAG TPA: two-component regulator propeller domain-containing protein [Bacteroidota bacterium]|nr:two-component regulator propeller domain-containing protein [Bacteroidota bacterium]
MEHEFPIGYSGFRVASNSILLRILLFFALAFGSISISFTQDDIPFDHLTVKDGLSQGSVLCIFQDSYGFIWLGTQDGLNRFDGYEFKIYKHDPSDPKSINDNFVLSIAEDSSRTLWIGTLNEPGFLNRFDRQTESFIQVPRDSVNLRGAKSGETHPRYTDPSGTLWSGGIGKGFIRTDLRTGAKKVFKHDPQDPRSLVDDRVYSVVGDHTGMIWIGTRNGLDRFDPRTETFTHFQHNPNDPHSLSDNYVWPIVEDKNGILWVGSYLGGLNRFDPKSETFTRYRHSELNPRSLAGDQIYSLFCDASGMIWVGMVDHGVDRFQPDLTNFENHIHDPAEPNTLADNNILGMCVDHTGSVWIGTGKGLDRWDRKSGTFTLYQHDPKNPHSIADNQAQTLFEDKSGVLWVGTLSSGLDRLDSKSNTFVHYKNDPADPQSLSDNRIYALCDDREGNLWVGTYAGGLCRLDPRTGKFTRFVHSDSLPSSLGGTGVWALLQGPDGVLWAGTSGDGLDRFDPKSGTFTHFTHKDSDTTSLSSDMILCLDEDRSGHLWVGTNGGLNRYDPATGTFRGYREKDGLANDVVFGILEDGSENLWMSTNKGISRFDVKKGIFRTYSYSDGLQGDEFNQGAYAADPQNGELFFGGAQGFNAFYPEHIKDNSFIPAVVFSAFTRYNSDDKQGRPIEEPGIEAKEKIVLSYKDNVATFRFSALNFYNAFKNQYAYKLEGFNNTWIHLGTDRRATFTNLDAGSYILRIRGSNNDGVWNEAGTSLQLTVTPPWWKTRTAYAVYAMLFVGFLYSVRRIEMNRKEQKAKIRESQLHAKAVEAEKRALQAENDRKTKELEDARTLQLSMLPKVVPQIPQYEITVYMKTATEVGGDYYDFSMPQDEVMNIAFGDATGHGMQAGIIVTLVKGLFVSDAAKSEIQTFFNHCSKSIKEIKLGRLFMALTLARINGKTVSLSSAGMPPAYLFRESDGSVEEILLKAVPLGAMKSFPYPLYETVLEKGDTLLLLTDGLPEQKNANGEMFDYARVTECFTKSARSTPQEIIDRLVAEGDAWMNGQAQDDDITLLVIKKKE